MWEEVGVPKENPCRHEENMQMPHRSYVGSLQIPWLPPQLVSGFEPITFLL